MGCSAATGITGILDAEIKPKIAATGITGILDAEIKPKILENLAVSRRYSFADLRKDFDMNSKWQIGAGMSGPVFAARHKSGIAYALKSFQKKQLTWLRQADLQQELDFFLKADHPHLARLVRVYISPSELHLVMELCEGGSLKWHIRRAGQDASWVGDIAKQMLLPIAYLHSLGVAHRDIKPANFVFESKAPNAKLKLIDFGFAHLSEKGELMHRSVGTLRYAAPEVLASSYPCKCDIWALGVTTFQLLTGRYPFDANNDDDVRSRIKRGAYIFLPEEATRIFEAPQAFIAACLAVRPADRISASQGLQQEWIKTQHAMKQMHAGLTKEVSHGIKAYTDYPPLLQKLLVMIAYSMASHGLEDLEDAFIALDAERSGRITRKDLLTAVSTRTRISPALHAKLCVDAEDRIDYSHFIAMALRAQLHLHPELLQDVHARLSRDTGAITRETIQEHFGELSDPQEIMDLFAGFGSTPTSGIALNSFEQFFEDHMDALSPTSQMSPTSPISPSLRQTVSLLDKLVSPTGGPAQRLFPECPEPAFEETTVQL